MSLVAGSVSVTGSGATWSWTGTGLALELMNFLTSPAKIAALHAIFTQYGDGQDPDVATVNAVSGTKAHVEGLAAVLVNYFTANAVVSVTIPATSINATDPAAPVVVTGGVT